MRSKTAQRILSETPEETKVFARLYAAILVRINQIMSEKELNQKELANKLNKQPSEINKWLKGDHNFTLRSLAKLQVELGEEIINVPVTRHNSSAISKRGKFSFTVYKNTGVNTEVEYINQWTKAKTKNNFNVNVS